MPRGAKDLLQDVHIRNAKPEAKPYKLADGGGLYIEILPTGTKSWRYYFRFGEGKPNKHGKPIKPQKTFTIGNYPEIGLSNAREQRDSARQMVREGKNPLVEMRYQTTSQSNSSFGVITEEWFSQNESGWSKSHASRLRGYLDRDILPPLGEMEAREIRAAHIIRIVKLVRDRGAIDAAKRVHGFIKQILDYAVIHEYADRNPAKDIDVKQLLPKVVKNHYAAVTDDIGIGNLLRAIENYQGSLTVRTALQIAPYVFLRPSELKDAEWCEIDLENSTWILPAKRRKLPTHIKKANRPDDALIIPLARQVVDSLQSLHSYTGRGKYVFTSPKGRSLPLSNNALRTALRIMGYDNATMTAHGFRALASTQLNEKLRYRSEVVEAQLGHVEKNEVKAAYNRSTYLDERIEMMQTWANHLDSLRTGADVVPFKKQA